MNKFIGAENALFGPVPLCASFDAAKKGNYSYGFSWKFGASVQLRGGCNWPKEAEAQYCVKAAESS